MYTDYQKSHLQLYGTITVTPAIAITIHYNLILPLDGICDVYDTSYDMDTVLTTEAFT